MGHLGTNPVRRSSPMVQWEGIVCALVRLLNVCLHHGNMVWDGTVVIPSPDGNSGQLFEYRLFTMSQTYDGASKIMLKYGQEIKPKHAQKCMPQEIKLKCAPRNQANVCPRSIPKKSSQ